MYDAWLMITSGVPSYSLSIYIYIRDCISYHLISYHIIIHEPGTGKLFFGQFLTHFDSQLPQVSRY